MRIRRMGYLAAYGAVAMVTSVLPVVSAAARSVPARATSHAAAAVWSQQFNDQYGAGPTAVAANPRLPIVYVTGWSSTAKHEVGFPGFPLSYFTTVAYNTSTGAQLWAASYEGDGYLGQGTPLITVNAAGTQVYVAGALCEGTPACESDPAGDGAAVVGYDATSGVTEWADSGFGVPPSVMGLARAGTELFLSGPARSAGYGTSAIDAKDGKVDWTDYSRIAPHQMHYESPTSIAVTADQSIVYVTGPQGTIGIANYNGGGTLWQKYTAAAVGTSAVVSQDLSELLVAGCRPPVQGQTCANTGLTGYSATTGARLWALPDDAAQVIASPSGPQVFVLTKQPGHTEIAAFDIATGTRTELWHTATVSGQIALNQKATTVYTGIGTGTVDAYNATTGAQVSSASDPYPGTVSGTALSMNGSRVFDTGGVAGTNGTIGYLTDAYRL